MKYVIMMVGKTHSGKTTFAEDLQKKISNIKIVQTDPISIFLKENYGNDINRDKEHDGSFFKPSLKVKVFRTIFEHMINEGENLVLANSNMHQKLRDDLVTEMHEANYKVIGVYLNFTEDFLMNRIIQAQKNIAPLNSSNSFPELLVRQRNFFVEPRNEEFDYFFEVNNVQDISEIKGKIIHLIENTS